MFKIIAVIIISSLISCAGDKNQDNMQKIAEEYVKLVLKTGQYDAAVVDAYYGPEDWKPAELNGADKNNFPKEKLIDETDNLLLRINLLDESILSDIEKKRKNFLAKQLTAIKTKIEIIGGKKYSFDQESKLLYDAVAPHYEQDHFKGILSQLDKLLPGEGAITKRYDGYRKQFIIPEYLLDTVFQTAINEGRNRTLKHINLPANESFRVEYVKNKPWGAYNWYKGNNFSVIQVNTDLPVYIERAVDLACHEGYPGHHVYNLLLEQNLLRKNNWVEFYVYPLFSPTSLIAEGTANYGIEVAFPGDDRIKFEKEVLFPLAGLDPNKADNYYKILELVEQLNYARNEASRKYYDGQFSKEQLKEWLVKYCLNSPERADKSIDFINTYGSYIINYNYGEELCRNYIENAGGTKQNPDKRWELFIELISKPYTASEIQ